MARRAKTLDPVLRELQAEIVDRLHHVPVIPPRDGERRRGTRSEVSHNARLRTGDLTLIGIVRDVGSGGVFLRTDLLIEVGERCSLALEYTTGEVDFANGVPVRVAWIRPNSHPHGPGLGLAFDARDVPAEKRALELLLALVDSATEARV